LKTIDKVEIEKFSKLAKDWWNPNGKFKPLHLINPNRVNFIKKKIIKQFNINPNNVSPLKNISILDIGCGGGLLCEPLNRLGAKVTGLDASKTNIEVAKLHAKQMDLNINYINSSPEKYKFVKKFNVILNMEIVEHVSNVDFFIQSCSNMVEKNGLMFVSTINRNLKSYFFAIIGAEYILRWLPIGTHDWDKFLTPGELEVIAKNKNFRKDELVGMKFNPISRKWYLSSDSSVNYISTFLKN
jgi:2-polyprenyl-6-hydroxyphenyl methylase / 3-demethylubiquinone-9 3-methyltransferase